MKRARGLVSIRVEPGTSAAELAAHLARFNDEIEYAYVPAIKYPAAKKAVRRKRKRRTNPAKTPLAESDPLSSRQWGHIAVHIHQARAAAGFVDADQIKVAIVDSGIDNNHPDLMASIDEYHNALDPNEDSRDYSGHGTHVAGIIAAQINNAIGIAGLSRARILAVKGLPGKSDWDAAKYYRALNYGSEHDARVLNLSIGGGFDPGEKDVIEDLIAAGVCVVAAMGNEFEEGNPTSYPAAYPNVIAVGATDQVDRRASFSNTGKHIALAAPGAGILSTVPTYPSSFAAQLDYDSWDGTSMATPHVAAAAALVLAQDPSMTPQQVRKRLMDTADQVPGQTAFNEEFGAGRLNVEAALS